MRAFNPLQLVRNNSDDIKLSECFFIFKQNKTKQNGSPTTTKWNWGTKKSGSI